MKKYILIFAACSMLLNCQQGGHKQEVTEEPEDPTVDSYEMPCNCKEGWLQEETTCHWDLVWDYPVKPGTEEWEQLRGRSPEEINAALQIPDDILFTLSTEDLTTICLQYPLLGISMVGYGGNLNYFIDLFFAQNKSFRELFDREDVSKELLKRYRCAMLQLADVTLSENQRVLIEIRIVEPLELLLSRCPAQNIEGYVEILQHLVCGADIGLSIFTSSNSFSRACLIIKIDEQYLEQIPKGKYNSVFMYGGYDLQTIRVINHLSCQIIQSNQ